MSQHSPFIVRRPGERGVALVLTLAILALVTLLLIAFVTSMRVENMASKNYNQVIQTRELARGAIDQAVAQIRQATPQRLPGGPTYVTFPGGAYVNSGTLPGTLYSLYSPPGSGGLTNLNGGQWITGGTNGAGEFPVNSPNSQINVGWAYVAQDPTKLPGANNPIIGRYAYWVDDEASKINVNTAAVPPLCGDALGACSTSNDVDLSVLLQPIPPFAYAANIQSGNATYPRATFPYVTAEQIKSVGLTADIFDDNRFEITTYSNDGNYPNYTDDLDVFDRQRVSLNPTTLNNALNITGAGDVTAAGAFDRLSASALMEVCGAGGGSTAFAAKYGVGGLEQIIANIVGYQIDPTATWPPDDGNSPPNYLGLARTPYINEIKITYTISGATPPYSVQRTIQVELYCMYGAYSPGTEQIVLNNLPTGPGNLFSAGPITMTPVGGGPYFVGTYSDPVPAQITTATTIPIQTTPTQIAYSRQYGGVYHRLHYAQMDLPQVILDPVNGPPTVFQDAEANDPAVGPWTPSTTASTIGSQNNAYHQTSDPTLGATAVPSKAVMRAALMLSVGELGYIHTPNAWQYLTLQPGGGASGGQIPDWAMLDIFTVGNGGSGRININSLINPGLATPNPVQARLVPLEALLNSLGLAGKASDIYADAAATRVTGADAYGMQQATGAGIFDTIGEVCEIPSLANGQTTQAGKEAAIRRIANLITVRSNTFTIWVLAQSIKQPPGSTIGTFNPNPPNMDLITGDVRAQAVVERYEKPPGSKPEYRMRYLRYLSN